MYSYRCLSLCLFCMLLALAPAASNAAQPGPPAIVSPISGQGEVVQPNFPTTVPVAIMVTDAGGTPVAGVPVNWTLSCAPVDYGCNPAFLGTLVTPTNVTDSHGMAMTNYTQTFVPPGLSYTQATLTSSTSVGGIPFKLTATAPFNGNSLTLISNIARPGPLGNISGKAGATMAAALEVNVSIATGFSAGQGVPNIGVRIVDVATGLPTTAATCNAPAGTVLTDTSGNAICDIVLGNTPGTFQLAARVGEQQNPPFSVTITQGQVCSITLSRTAEAFPGSGGSDFFSVIADPGCPWTATSNAPFITITSSTSGTGNGNIGFTVGTNSGAARSGTISVGGQTFTVSQSGNGSLPGGLTITSNPNLPGATQGAFYSTSLTASGGTGVYSWTVTAGALPPGLILSNNLNVGVISGTPSTAGNYPFTVTLSDGSGAILSQAFTISVGNTSTSGGFTVLTTAAANGVVGTPYSQALTYSQSPNTSCGSPLALPVFTLSSGTLPPGLSIQNGMITGTPTTAGTYPFSVVVGNSFCQSPPAPLSITIFGTGTSTVLSANPATLSFNVALNGAAPASQQIAISSTGSSLALTATVNVGWLAITLSPSSTPTTLTVSAVNYQSLTAGAYQGLITINGGGGNVLTIPVTLNVTGTPNTVGLTLSTSSLSFNLPSNSYSQQVVTVLGSANNANVAFLATATTTTGAPWLGLVTTGGATPAAGVTGTTPTNLGVTVNTANLPPGKYLGSVIVQQQGTGFSLTLSVTVNVTAVTLSVDTQSLAFTFVPGVTPPAPQTINLLSSVPIPVTVTTTTAAGGNWLFTTSSGATPTAITVTVNPVGLSRGTYNGTVILTPQDPTIAPVKIPVTLTISAGAGPVINGVVNSASNAPGPVSPGEFITIYGTGLGSTTPAILTLTAAGMISTTLSGTQVTFDGIPAPLVYVSATQVNAIVPYEIFGRTSTQLQVQYNGGTSQPVDLGVALSAPGIFLCLDCQPSTQAAALNQDNTPNSVANGALPNSTITLFATGEGQTNPAGITGSITSSTLAQPLLPVSVRIGGLPATVSYAGSAPSLAEGVLQVNVQIPATVPRGSLVDVTLTIGDAMSNTAKIAIAP